MSNIENKDPILMKELNKPYKSIVENERILLSIYYRFIIYR